MNVPSLILLSVVLGLTDYARAANPPLPKFEAQTIDGKVAIGYGVAIGDVDGDGKPDILLADKRQIAWYRNGDWKQFVMAADLTPQDDVCIAARDINGDGRVEVAVGANWNPGETSDLTRSGAVFYLIRPKDPTQRWEPVKLHHEPTVHRMAWIKAADGKYQLVVVPLHGRGNKNGQGAGARVLAYDVPADPRGPWSTHLIDDSMHVTHNFDVVHWDSSGDEDILLGGREGIALLRRQGNVWSKQTITSGSKAAASEVRMGKTKAGRFLAAVEPWHGNTLVVYTPSSRGRPWQRTVLADDLDEGHGLACADLLGLGCDQIVVGWRNPNAEKKVGIRLVRAARCLRLTLEIVRDRRQHDGLRGLEGGGPGRRRAARHHRLWSQHAQFGHLLEQNGDEEAGGMGPPSRRRSSVTRTWRHHAMVDWCRHLARLLAAFAGPRSESLPGFAPPGADALGQAVTEFLASLFGVGQHLLEHVRVLGGHVVLLAGVGVEIIKLRDADRERFILGGHAAMAAGPAVERAIAPRKFQLPLAAPQGFKVVLRRSRNRAPRAASLPLGPVITSEMSKPSIL